MEEYIKRFEEQETANNLSVLDEPIKNSKEQEKMFEFLELPFCLSMWELDEIFSVSEERGFFDLIIEPDESFSEMLL